MLLSRSFCTQESGSTAVAFAIVLMVLVGFIGLAVDYTRATNVRTKLQAAADAAVLSGKSRSDQSVSEMQVQALAAFNQNYQPSHDVHMSAPSITVDGDELSVAVRAELDQTFSSIIGPDTVTIEVKARAMSATPDLELALVLDNTGSMAPFMGELRTGANDLVDMLFARSGAARMKFAVVPYVGTVNIGNGALQRTWMDLGGEAPWHAAGIENKGIGWVNSCSSGGSGPPDDPGVGDQGSLWDLWPTFAALTSGIFSTPAQAASAADVPTPFYFGAPCMILNPGELNTFDLLEQIPNAEWRGCVEARAEPHDVTDTVPSLLDAETLFVPWFWPDEVDAGPMVAAQPGFVSFNDYLPDRLDLRFDIAPAFDDPWPGWGWASILKYNGTNATIDEVAPDTMGPNKACPDPILPLTNEHTEITAKIDGLMHWNGSGTNVAEGLAWGWRALSPAPPFTEGASYGEATKVIVLMTDGVNNVDPHPGAPVFSQYSAYGYLQQWGESRLGDKSFAGFRNHANERLALVCQNAKDEGVMIYTVAFGITDDTTLGILRDCATAPPYAYSVSTAADLVTAFRDVASKLSQLRLSR